MSRQVDLEIASNDLTKRGCVPAVQKSAKLLVSLDKNTVINHSNQRCGSHVRPEMPKFRSEFNSVDLPTLGIPTTKTFVSVVCGFLLPIPRKREQQILFDQVIQRREMRLKKM